MRITVILFNMMLILKLTGTALIIFTSSAAGFRISESLAEYEKYLQRIILLINRISDMIEYSTAHTCEILNVLSGDDELKKLYFVKKAAVYCRSGMQFSEAWKKAVREDDVIGKRECEILEMIGSSLGTSGRKSQLSMLALHSCTLRGILESQSDEIKRRRKLFSSLGILAGAMISVLLI